MFSTVQVQFLSEIACQYDYYVAYYYGNYYDYQIGDVRDSKIILICSDQQPTFDNGTYFFSDCNYYEVTSNKYILLEESVESAFSPLGSSDIVYSNVIEGAPQLCYSVSAIRSDAPVYVMYGSLVFFALLILIRLLFGR